MSKVSEHYDNISSRYDAAFDKPIDKAEERYLYDFLPMYLGDTVDLGCGTGLTIKHRFVGRYVGLDISEGMLKEAEVKYHSGSITFHRWDMNQPFSPKDNDRTPLNIPQMATSVVSMFGSFNFSLNPLNTLAYINYVLKPKGRFYLHILTPKYDRRGISKGVGLPALRYRLKDIERLFSATDFKIVNVHPVNRLAWYLPLPEPLLYRLLGAEKIGEPFSYLVIGEK